MGQMLKLLKKTSCKRNAQGNVKQICAFGLKNCEE
jgi:hypothetical protein